MLGWHFLKEDRKMQFEPYELVEEGKTYTCKGDLCLCHNGLHASKRMIDALKYAPGPIICRVELQGEIIHHTDKSVARTRKVLWMLDATNILHEFACRCAEDALALVKNPDPRSVAAIQAKRDWLKGEIIDTELAAAAARAAARYATSCAAWAADRAAARYVARDAASYAARVADRATARDVASYAAMVAAWAEAATWDKLNRRLTQMVAAERRNS